jgi:hypothetical protein
LLIEAGSMPINAGSKLRPDRDWNRDRISEAGRTDEEMVAVPGHKSATSPRIYTKGAKQTRLTESAITDVEQNSNKTSPTRSSESGELPKKDH